MDELPNTPGLWGYVLAVGVSVTVLPTLYLVPALLVSVGQGAAVGELGGVAVLGLYAVVFVAVVAAPLACVGVPVIHLLCREQPSQVVHVVVTGVVTAGLVLAMFVTMNGFDLHDAEVHAAVATLAAVSTMVGRAAVVPMVASRRRRDASRGAPDRRTQALKRFIFRLRRT